MITATTAPQIILRGTNNTKWKTGKHDRKAASNIFRESSNFERKKSFKPNVEI
jgi:hypothetical protein